MLRARAAVPLLLRAGGAAAGAGPAAAAAAGAAGATGAGGATNAVAAAVSSSASAASALGWAPSSAAAAAALPLFLRRAYAHLTIAVPPMGDSISEGTVATVLKKAGEAVEENETIAQIETDKVTIDVKAPSGGVVVGFSVKEQDTVVPGQALATLDASAAAADAAASASAPAPSSAPAPAAATPVASSSSAPAAAAAAPPPQAHARTPSIRFPPRVTADGRRISDLSPAEAAAAAAAAAGAGAAAPKAAAAAAAPTAAAAAAPSAPALASSTAALRGNGIVAGARPRARAPGPAIEIGDRALSQLEMDMIELGGAMPYEKKEKKKKG